MRMPATNVFRRAGCREIRLSGSTRGEGVAPSVSPSLLLYQSAEPDRRNEWRFRTPLGLAFASLKEEQGQGRLVLRIDVGTTSRYIEPGKYSALGALAFWEVPEIRGTSTTLRLTAVPHEWTTAADNVVSILARAGLRTRIVGSSLEVENAAASPTSLITRTALALYALDSFSKSHTPRTQFETLRLAAIKAFKDVGSELIGLLDDATGEHGLRSLLPPSRTATTRRDEAPRTLSSDEHAPEILTGLGRKILVEEKQWRGTFNALSRLTVDPRWLVYIPYGMCSIQTDQTDGPLEHPRTAFDYYKNEGIKRLAVQFKHMGSRAIVVVCRDEAAAMRRFGVAELGSVYSRKGRPFFNDSTEALHSIRDGLSRARFWEKFQTDWVCLDGEYLPWTLKAEKLLEQTHGQVFRCGAALLDEMEKLGSLLPSTALSPLAERRACFVRYGDMLDHYRAEEGQKLRFAPFQLIATEGRTYFNRSHHWHMEVLGAIGRKAGEVPFLRTPNMSVSVDDQSSVAQCVEWWEKLAQSGAEGLVVKPPYCISEGRRGIAQPAIKCRTPEHLRLVYGPEYDLIENRWELANRDAVKRRREKHRRVLKQLALSIEGVERFVRGEPAGQVENCVRSVLSLDK